MEQRIDAILSGSKTVTVVGISDKPDRPSHGVAKYLQEQGYRVIPVNPLLTEVLGEKAYKSLTEIPERVDLVDVFRKSATFRRSRRKPCGSGPASSGCRRGSKANGPARSWMPRGSRG